MYLTCQEFMNGMSEEAVLVVMDNVVMMQLDLSGPCDKLLELGLPSWQADVARVLQTYDTDVIMRLGAEIYLRREEVRQRFEPVAMTLQLCLAEQAALDEWKKNEPHLLDCHRHDGALLALGTLIRHFKKKVTE